MHQIKWVAPETLKPNPYNARTHSKKQVRQIAGSISAFGFVVPIVADENRTFLLSGTGDLIEPDDGLAAIGSGGPLAVAAARALTKHTSMSAAEVAREALQITSGIDIYTNDEITVEEL